MKPTIIEGRVIGNIYDMERDKKLKQELEQQGKKMPMNKREILEELANGIASIEPASCCMKSYRRLVIQLPETSLATVAEFNRAIQESS